MKEINADSEFITDVKRLTGYILKYFPDLLDEVVYQDFFTRANNEKYFRRIFNKAKKINKTLIYNSINVAGREVNLKKYTKMAIYIADAYNIEWQHVLANNRDSYTYNVRLIIFRELQNRGVQNDIIAEILNRKENTLTAWGYDIYHKMKDNQFKKLYEIIENKSDYVRMF